MKGSLAQRLRYHARTCPMAEDVALLLEGARCADTLQTAALLIEKLNAGSRSGDTLQAARNWLQQYHDSQSSPDAPSQSE